MTTREEWLSLSERCAKAEGPDRDIDRCIIAYLPDEHTLIGCGGYTESLDVITGLIARALPGWHWEVGADRSAMMRNPGEWRGAADDICIWGAASPALALCEAFCLAMAEKAK